MRLLQLPTLALLGTHRPVGSRDRPLSRTSDAQCQGDARQFRVRSVGALEHRQRYTEGVRGDATRTIRRPMPRPNDGSGYTTRPATAPERTPTSSSGVDTEMPTGDTVKDKPRRGSNEIDPAPSDWTRQVREHQGVMQPLWQRQRPSGTCGISFELRSRRSRRSVRSGGSRSVALSLCEFSLACRCLRRS